MKTSVTGVRLGNLLASAATIALVSGGAGGAFAAAPTVDLSGLPAAPVHAWRPTFLVKPPAAAVRTARRVSQA